MIGLGGDAMTDPVDEQGRSFWNLRDYLLQRSRSLVLPATFGQWQWNSAQGFGYPCRSLRNAWQSLPGGIVVLLDPDDDRLKGALPALHSVF